MQSLVSDFFANLLSYINILFENQLILYLVALMIVAGLIGMFYRIIKIKC